MIGIVGIISRQSEDICRSNLELMIASLEKENFYQSGTCCIKEMGVYVGWMLHENASNGCMPIRNEESSALLIFSGEVYPSPEEIDDLKKRSHEVGSGASYMIHAYEERGVEFISNLNGWYSGTLIDKKKNSCFIFNDRYGMKRLFIHESNDGLIYASSAKAILAVIPETRSYDYPALAEYLTCGCTLGTRSLYAGINVLPPASIWSARNGALERKSVYFRRSDWECQDRIDAKQLNDQLLDLFPAVVKNYGKAEVPIGISLTGGYDSRMLVACLDMKPREYPCYTFGSMYRDPYDVIVARKVAEDCHQNHTVLVLGNDYLRQFPRYMEGAVSRSDGYIGLSGAAELYVNSLARNIAPIRLTGNYGSELLRGAQAFKSILPREGLLDPELKPYLREAQEVYGELKKNDPISFALFFQAPCQGYGRLSIEESQVIMRTPFMDNNLVKLMYRRPLVYDAGAELSTAIIGRYRPELLNIPTDRGTLGNGSCISKYVNRMYREALYRGEYWASHGMPQWVATLTRCLPWLPLEQYLLGRQKFQHYNRWLRNELSEYVRDVLSSATEIPTFFEKRNLEKMVNDHLEGRRNYVNEIDKVVTMTLSARLLLRQQTPLQSSSSAE